MTFIETLSDRQRELLASAPIKFFPGLADPSFWERRIDWKAIDSFRDPGDDSKQQR